MDGTQVLSALGNAYRIFMEYGNAYRVGQYLSNVTPESCLDDLNKALSVKSVEFKHLEDIFNMFSATGSTGSRYWDQASLTKYLKAKHPDNPVIESCAPLLWRCFLYHAYLPFSQRRSLIKAARENGCSSIDFKAFQRAATLLVLKGVDLLGSSQHGDRILPRSQYSRYRDQRPRLAKLMFNGLSVPTEKVQLEEEKEETSPDASPDLYVRPEQEIFDTLISIQPCGIMHSPSDTQTRVHAQRLLSLDTMSKPCRILQRNDLEAVVQLLLLVRVTKQLWVHNTYPPCEDVYYAHLVSDSAEVALAAKLASVLIKYLSGDEYSEFDWPSFYDICTSSFPFLVFSFSQLWTSIFAPHKSSDTHEQLEANSPNSIVRFLSLIELAEFKYTHMSGPQYNELQLQLDLQTAFLIADLNAEAGFDSQTLLEEFHKKDRFNFLLLSGQKEMCKSDDDARNVLVVAFLSQLGKKIRHQGMRDRIEYAWRVSILQLQPELRISRARGMVFGLRGEVLTFLASDDKSNDAASLRLDLQNRSAVMVGTVEEDALVAPDGSTDAATRLLADAKASKERTGGDVKGNGQIWSLQMKLQGLQCYRMPGKIR